MTIVNHLSLYFMTYTFDFLSFILLNLTFFVYDANTNLHWYVGFQGTRGWQFASAFFYILQVKNLVLQVNQINISPDLSLLLIDT